MTKKQLRIPFKDGKPCKWIKDDHDEEQKSNCLTTVMKDNVISSLPPGRYLNAFDLKDKFRYLTPVEMCRLQTLPDDYLDGIAPNTAMSLAGNGWTVDVIAHLLKGIECR